MVTLIQRKFTVRIGVIKADGNNKKGLDLEIATTVALKFEPKQREEQKDPIEQGKPPRKSLFGRLQGRLLPPDGTTQASSASP